MSDSKYKVGNFVRIVSVPDLQDEKMPKETIDIFGSELKVMLWLFFTCH